MFKEGQFDVIYANTVVSFKVALELKNKLRIPVVGHVHEAEALMHYLRINQNYLNEIDAFISVSNLSSRNLMFNYGIPADRITIHYPISAWVINDINNSSVTKAELFGDNQFLIGVFCDGSWFKSTEMIPVIMSVFYSKYPSADCRFVVIGRMHKETEYHLNYDLKKIHMEDRIVYYGRSDNPLSIEKRLDVLLLLSREESFSLVAQEAALMGTPIVGFEGVTGAAEWIKDECGFLVPYYDFEAMADAIFSLYSDDELRHRLGQQAHVTIEKMYKDYSNMNNIIQVICSVSGNKNLTE